MSQQCSVLSSPKRQGPDGSWVASDLPLDNGFPRLPDPSFLAFGVCPLVIEASLEACSGFPVGGAGACPLVVELGLGPMVGRAMSKGRV